MFFLIEMKYVTVQIHCHFEWLCSISAATKHNNGGVLFTLSTISS